MSEGRADERDSHGGAPGEGASFVRHEEELRLGKRTQDVGSVRVRKGVAVEPVAEDIPRLIEYAGDNVERVAAREEDSGEVEVLADGSVSIPLLEERLVVSKETFVRERLIVRKERVHEDEHVEAEVRREYVDLVEDRNVTELERLVERDVVSADGDSVGSIERVFRAAEQSDDPGWVTVRTGSWPKTRSVLAPLVGVALHDEHVQLPWSKEEVETAPRCDDEIALLGDAKIGDSSLLSPEKRQEAYAHYGVEPFATGPSGEIRRWRLARSVTPEQ